MTPSIDRTIIAHLIFSDSYAKKVVPFLKAEYFHDPVDQTLFRQITAFYAKYLAGPTVEALAIEVDKLQGVNESVHQQMIGVLTALTVPEKAPDQWLIDATEAFCSEKAIYNAIMEGIHILDGSDKEKRDKGVLPKIMADALAVSFDTHIGHDFLDNADERFALYHREEARLPFDLEMLNKITRGGLPKKTLNTILAGVGVGKTLTMCHFAAANLTLGKQVLYITMEMSETEIAKRIDANLMDVEIAALESMGQSDYERKIERIRQTTKGKLIIKEYPTAGAHAGHFRHLINELHLKRNFVPDVIYIDYINICQSSRAKMSAGAVNSYTLIKSIAEELRGLASEKDVPIVTATQLNRTGFGNVDPSMTDTAESFGLPATCDLLMAMVTTEELEAENHVMFKQLKSRYNDINKDRRFVVGINRAKMRLYDVANATEAFTIDHDKGQKDVPVFDNSDMGRRMIDEARPAWGKTKKRDFSGFKTEI
jgi:replicative DNA helicase